MTSDGKRNGFGVFYQAGGRIRIGYFKDNMLQGNMVYVNKDLTIVEGTNGWYENGVIQSEK